MSSHRERVLGPDLFEDELQRTQDHLILEISLVLGTLSAESWSLEIGLLVIQEDRIHPIKLLLCTKASSTCLAFVDRTYPIKLLLRTEAQS